MNKKRLNPIIIILIVVLFCIQVLIIVSLCVRLIQPGGADSISSLVSDYQTAVNNADEDLYLSLVPKSEKNGLEREYVQEKLRAHYNKGYQISENGYTSLGSEEVGEVFGELLVLDPFGSPVPSDVIDLNILVTDQDNNTYTAKLTILEISDKYFIHDVTLY